MNSHLAGLDTPCLVVDRGKVAANAERLKSRLAKLGVPLRLQSKIFRKFYRGSDAELRAGAGGTGLGLFIARGLVTAMGGRIWVSSQEGEGSRFVFELPAAAVAPTENGGE